MNNDVLLVPTTVEQPNVEAQSDIVVYVPQAHKNKAGIVKEGDGILVENGVVSLDKTTVQDMVDAVDATLTDKILDVDDKIVAHINDFENPHRVTKEQIGLSNVDNTSDLDKPVSNATKIELDDIKTTLKGYNKSVAYSSYREMIDVLNVSQKDDFFTGQSIFINTKDVPDLWVFGVEQTQHQYIYENDDAVLDEINNSGFVRIGYYKIAALETQKTIVGNYVTLDTEQTITSWKNFDISKIIDDQLTLTHDDTYKHLSLQYRDSSTNKNTFVYINPKKININPNDSFDVVTQTGGSLWVSNFVSFSTDGTQENNSAIRIYDTEIQLKQNKDELRMAYGSLLYNNKELLTTDALSDYVTTDALSDYVTPKDVVEPAYKTGYNNDILKSNVIKLKSYSLSTPRYYKLCEFLAQNNQDNYSSISIEGRMGGWVSTDMAQWEILFSNRNSYASVSSVLSLSSKDGLTQCDLVVYEQEDKSCVMYLKCFQYYTLNFEINTVNCNNVYDGTFTTETPVGTLKWSLSESDYVKVNALKTVDLSNYVTLDTDQTITGFKDFDYNDGYYNIYFRKSTDSYDETGVYLNVTKEQDHSRGYLGISPASFSAQSKTFFLRGLPNDETTCVLSFEPEGVELYRGKPDNTKKTELDLYTDFARFIINDELFVLNNQGFRHNNEWFIKENDVKNNYISYTTQQTLTDEQKEIARNNIGAGTGSGGSIDLSNYVTLDTNQTITGLKTTNYTSDDGKVYINLDPLEPYINIKDNSGEGFSFESFYGWLMLKPTLGFQSTTSNEKSYFYTGIDSSNNNGITSFRATSASDDTVKSVFKLIPEGAFYNDKEIATKDDIISAIQNTWEASY